MTTLHCYPRLLKLPEVATVSGRQATAIYERIKNGLFPPPIKLTARASAWVEHEVAVVNAASIAGKSDKEIRKLVRELVASRDDVFQSVTKHARQATSCRT